jgi:hypothetical protein
MEQLVGIHCSEESGRALTLVACAEIEISHRDPIEQFSTFAVAALHSPTDSDVLRALSGRRRPDGAAWIADAELIAREVRNFNDVGAAVPPRFTRHQRLPAFRYAPLDPYTWPPARK